jgi:hypothetical protein
MTRTPTNAIGLFTIALVLGCSGSAAAPGTVKAAGTVKLNGAPLAGAQVTFYPASADVTLASQAATDDSGHYELQTHVGGGKFKPGVAPGKYTVSITKLDTANVKNTFAPPKNLLPARYADPKTSKLTADVSPSGQTPIDFELTSQ